MQPDNALVTWAVHTTSGRSASARLGGITVAAGLDKPDTILAGGHLFAENCSVCHGGPGLKSTNIAQGLNPEPPDLFRATRKPDPAENFRFIKYGVKMTTMPGLVPPQTDDQIWQLVAFLGAAPGMSPTVFTTQTGLSAATKTGGKAAGG